MNEKKAPTFPRNMKGCALFLVSNKKIKRKVHNWNVNWKMAEN